MNSLINGVIIDPIKIIDNIDLLLEKGKVSNIIGMTIESIGPSTKLGGICRIMSDDNTSYLAEVVGFKDTHNLLMTFDDVRGLSQGCEVVSEKDQYNFPLGEQFIGRVINGLGKPIDGKGFIVADDFVSVSTRPINPLKRIPITEPLCTGIKAIDSLITIGKGQRVGIFSGTGIGKSILLGMIARGSSADINVIALVGERGREVRDFIENNLGEEGLKNSIVVVATSDETALMRVKGAFLATAIAEYFRDKGKNVILMMDSITRFARALREIGLAIGEPPTTKGFPPSLFSILPKILERPGNTGNGSITGIYTILVEGDDLNNPVEDEVRAILDGHIILDRKLANKNRYPAIDVLSSISRIMRDVVSKNHLTIAEKIKENIAIYKDVEDLITIGAYTQGLNKKIDYAIENIEKISDFLKQDISDLYEFDQSLKEMEGILS